MHILTSNSIDISITFTETGELDTARGMVQMRDDQAQADASGFVDDCPSGEGGAGFAP